MLERISLFSCVYRLVGTRAVSWACVHVYKRAPWSHMSPCGLIMSHHFRCMCELTFTISWIFGAWTHTKTCGIHTIPRECEANACVHAYSRPARMRNKENIYCELLCFVLCVRIYQVYCGGHVHAGVGVCAYAYSRLKMLSFACVHDTYIHIQTYMHT